MDLGDPLAPFALQQHRIVLFQRDGQPEILGVIRHHKPVERALQPRRNAIGGHDRLTLGEAIGIVGRERCANQPGIGGIGGVQVGVAEEHLVWVLVQQIGRIGDRRVEIGRDIAEFLCVARPQARY